MKQNNFIDMKQSQMDSYQQVCKIVEVDLTLQVKETYLHISGQQKLILIQSIKTF